jgi:phage/plasmid-associated DNA primase
LKKRGRFEETDTVVQAVQDFKVTSDPLRYWLSEEVKVHPLGNGHDLVWVSLAELYSEYKIFCDDAGFDALNKIAFGKKLAGIIDEYDKRVKMGGPKNQRARGLIGITKAYDQAFQSNKLFTYGGDTKDSMGKVDVVREASEPGSLSY